MQRQGKQDYACALYCIVSAAIYLGAQQDDGGGGARTIANLGAGRAEPVSTALLTCGVGVNVVRELAVAAGLSLWRPNRRADRLDDFASRSDRPGDGTLWMALLMVSFEDPVTGDASQDLHYVLVLEVTTDGVVVADPHPWRKPIYVMSRDDFLSAWEVGRRRNRPPKWAGCLGRARG